MDGSMPFGFNIIYLLGGFGGAGGNGGGIYNNGQCRLNFITIGYNGSGNGGNGTWGVGGGNGGTAGNGSGIFNSGLLNLNTCTVSGNFCGSGGIGGGAWYWGTAGTGGNGGNGGGIYNAGSFTLISCTVALNMAGVGGNAGNDTAGYISAAAAGGAGGCGGGILNETSVTNAIVLNTLIALNTANAGGAGGTSYYNDMSYTGVSGSNGFGFDLVGNFASQGYNLVGMTDINSTGFTNGVNADQVGSNASPIDPLLGPLQMNGGFTPTCALLWGSPAIDQGNCFGIHRDQRGHRRPYSYPSVRKPLGGDGSDIGAFELDSLRVPPLLWNLKMWTSNSKFDTQSKCFGFTVSGTSNQVIVVEACTNLANPLWTPIQTNTLIGGSSDLDDPQWTNFPSRYYRVRSP